MENKPESLSERLSSWLAKQGYALEFASHHAFKKAGFNPLLGTYISNPEGVLREIDISLTEELREDGRIPIEIRLCCECKYSKDRPWLLIDSNEKGDMQQSWHNLPHSPSLEGAVSHGHVFTSQWGLNQTEHFRDQQRWSHSLIQGLGKEGGDNRDDAFNALRKIADAAWDWAEEWSRLHNFRTLTVVVPCIIVDGELFRANFNPSESRFDVEPIESGRLLWSGCRGGTLVDVVQATALDKYAKSLRQSFSAAKHFLTKLAEEIR